MTNAYFNYPNSNVTIHSKFSCPHIQRSRKLDQRRIVLSCKTFDEGFQELSKMRMQSDAAFNDLWLVADFGNKEFEAAVVRYSQDVLGKRYTRLRNCDISKHC
jgi:hypothetical protein